MRKKIMVYWDVDSEVPDQDLHPFLSGYYDENQIVAVPEDIEDTDIDDWLVDVHDRPHLGWSEVANC